jgi:hypothetical protein
MTTHRGAKRWRFAQAHDLIRSDEPGFAQWLCQSPQIAVGRQKNTCQRRVNEVDRPRTGCVSPALGGSKKR